MTWRNFLFDLIQRVTFILTILEYVDAVNSEQAKNPKLLFQNSQLEKSVLP